MYHLKDIIPNKLAIHIATKCGSRTVLGYAYLLRNPNAIQENPEWFSPNGIYWYTVELEKNILIPYNTTKSKNYPFLATIVRHPVERFSSAFVDRIRTYSGNEKLSVDEFIELYDSFSHEHAGTPDALSKNSIYKDIKYHITPLHIWYGKNANIYTHIFNLRQMSDIKTLIENISETKLPELRLNETNACKKLKLTKSQKEWILSTFKQDIEIYGKWM
jgi:hypothetical protein